MTEPLLCPNWPRCLCIFPGRKDIDCKQDGMGCYLAPRILPNEKTVSKKKEMNYEEEKP